MYHLNPLNEVGWGSKERMRAPTGHVIASTELSTHLRPKRLDCVGASLTGPRTDGPHREEGGMLEWSYRPPKNIPRVPGA